MWWSRGETSKAEALPEEGGSARVGGGRGRRRRAQGGRGGTREGGVGLLFLIVVDEVAADPIGAEANGMEGTTRLRLVLRVSA